MSDVEKDLCAWLMKSVRLTKESEKSYTASGSYHLADRCRTQAAILEEIAAAIETGEWKRSK